MGISFYQSLKICLPLSIAVLILICLFFWLLTLLTVAILGCLPMNAVVYLLYHPKGGLIFYGLGLFFSLLVLRIFFNKMFIRKYKDFQIKFVDKNPSLIFYGKYVTFLVFFDFLNNLLLSWSGYNFVLKEPLSFVFSHPHSIPSIPWVILVFDSLGVFMIPALITVYLLNFEKGVYVEKESIPI